MAIRKMDSFQHYDSSRVVLKHSTWFSTLPTVVTPGRYGGGQCLSLNNGVAGFQDIFDAQATWIVGIAFRQADLGQVTSIITLLDNGSSQVDLRLLTSGLLQVTRNGTQLGIGTTVLLPNVWYYVELKATIHPSTGSMVVHLNGAAEISVTGANTRTTANSTADTVRIYGIQGAPVPRIADYYACDGSGSVNNDFLGNVRVVCMSPNAPGNYAQFTNSPEPNFGNVDDDIVPDDDGTFNFSGTAGQIDSFAFEDAPISTGTILAIQHNLLVRTDSAGARTIASLQRSAGTDYVGPSYNPPGSYVYHTPVRDTNPATSAQFTLAEFNAAEFGYKLIA